LRKAVAITKSAPLQDDSEAEAEAVAAMKELNRIGDVALAKPNEGTAVRSRRGNEPSTSNEGASPPERVQHLISIPPFVSFAARSMRHALRGIAVHRGAQPTSGAQP